MVNVCSGDHTRLQRLQKCALYIKPPDLLPQFAQNDAFRRVRRAGGTKSRWRSRTAGQCFSQLRKKICRCFVASHTIRCHFGECRRTAEVPRSVLPKASAATPDGAMDSAARLAHTKIGIAAQRHTHRYARVMGQGRDMDWPLQSMEDGAVEVGVQGHSPGDHDAVDLGNPEASVRGEGRDASQNLTSLTTIGAFTNIQMYQRLFVNKFQVS